MNIYKKKYWLLLVILFIILITVGCEGKSGITIPESEWKQGQGDLSNITGSKGSYDIQTPEEPYGVPLGKSLEKTEYDTPTDKWFGKMGYGIPLGTMKAGEAYSVSLFGHKENGNEIDRDVRMQLTERENLYERKKLIKEDIIHVDTVKGEKTIYSSELPDAENVTYLFSMEILDSAENAEDTLVGFIYVPDQEMNAELRLDRDVYDESVEEAILTLENFGPTILSFGEYYSIEKKVDNSWKEVPLDYEFVDIGIYMDPGDQHEGTIDIAPLEPGHYRVVKEFDAEGLDLTATLAAEFKIK